MITNSEYWETVKNRIREEMRKEANAGRATSYQRDANGVQQETRYSQLSYSLRLASRLLRGNQGEAVYFPGIGGVNYS